MKSTKVGKINEKLTHEALSTLFVHVYTIPTIKYGNGDMFNLWDHVAITDDGESVWVQTKSRKPYGKELDVYKDFPAKHKYLFYWEKEGDVASLHIINL